METEDDLPGPDRQDGSRPSRPALEEILASYIDRLTDGEKLNRHQILAEQPELGLEILEHLEAFVGFGADGGSKVPLGALGDYQLRRKIGRGGMGVVYDAWQGSMDRRVALKVLPSGMAADTKTVMRFVREARAAGKLHHPNVVSVYGMGVESDTPYYAMEYVEGETLAQLLVRLRKAEPESETSFGKNDCASYFENLARAFAAVADGLQHAHSKGIIHRDIKPSNLILDGEGRLRILDFGLAQIKGLESLSVSGDVVGTPLYMSPEQAMAKQVPIDHRTDVYSLGATLYEMITQEPPFRGRTYQDTMSQIILRDPAPLRKGNPRVPRDLEIIVLKCLRKDPRDRYGTAEALAQDLLRFVRGDPIEARPESRSERLLRRIRANRGRIAAALLALALVAATILAVQGAIERRDESARRECERAILSAAMKIGFGQLRSKDIWGGDPPAPTAELLGQGNLASRLGDVAPDPLEDAVKELAAAIATYRKAPPEAYYHRARALALLKRRDKAKADILRALEGDPRFAPALILKEKLDGQTTGLHGGLKGDVLPSGRKARPWARAHLEALMATGEGRWKDAVAAYDVLVASDVEGHKLYLGASIENLLGRAVARFKAEDFEGAANDFEIARELWPQFIEPTLLLGKCSYRRGQAEETEKIFRELYEGRGRGDAIAFWIVATYMSLGDAQGALRWVDRIGKSSVREKLKARIHFDRGQDEDAIRSAEEAVRLDPDDSDAHYLRAVAINRHRWWSDRSVIPAMIDSLKEAIRCDPTNVKAYAFLGQVYFTARDLAKAEEVCRKAIRVNPESLHGWWGLHIVLVMQGKVEAVLAETWDRIAELGTDDAYVQRGFGGAHAAFGDYEAALRFYDAAIRLDPRLPMPRIDAGTVSLRLGRRDQAQGHLRAAIERGLTFPRPYYNYFLCSAYSMLAFTLVGTEDFGGADRVADEAIHRFPELADSPEFHSFLAWIDEKRGDAEAACTHHLEAMAIDPGFDLAGRELARLLRASDAPALPQGKELEAALATFAAAAAAPDAHPYVCMALAVLLANGGSEIDRAEALALARRALEGTDGEAPERSEMLAAAAQVEFVAGEKAEAVRDLEEAIGLPGATRDFPEILGRYRKALAPYLSSYASIDAALAARDPAVDGELLDSLSTSGGEEGSENLRRYLKGYVLERGGQPGEALREFQAIAAGEARHPEPHLRVAACLAASGDAAGAERYLRGLLEKGALTAPALWERWAVLCLVDLALPPGEVLSRLPDRSPGGGEETSADRTVASPARPGRGAAGSADASALRWLLERLALGEPIRIDCGGEGYRGADGRTWGPDRFWVGGRLTQPFFQDLYFADEVHRTEDDALYHTERWFPPEELPGGYRIPLLSGRYRVALHFVEFDQGRVGFYELEARAIAMRTEGPRRFDVRIGDRIAFEGVEPLASGFATADICTFETEVADGILRIEFVPRVWEPVISAIEIETLN